MIIPFIIVLILLIISVSFNVMNIIKSKTHNVECDVLDENYSIIMPMILNHVHSGELDINVFSSFKDAAEAVKDELLYVLTQSDIKIPKSFDSSETVYRIKEMIINEYYKLKKDDTINTNNDDIEPVEMPKIWDNKQSENTVNIVSQLNTFYNND